MVSGHAAGEEHNGSSKHRTGPHCNPFCGGDWGGLGPARVADCPCLVDDAGNNLEGGKTIRSGSTSGGFLWV